jgi:nitric oxide dioxygenase
LCPRPGLLPISVKREGAPDDAPEAPAGLASNYLHDQNGPETVVRVSAPAGDFFLDAQDGRPLVLLSGGVGPTPILSMLDTLVAQDTQRDIWYVHAAHPRGPFGPKGFMRMLEVPDERIHFEFFGPAEALYA